MGGLFRFKGQLDPQPAVKHNPWIAAGIPLYRPNISYLMQNDVPFTAVIESRRSIRNHSAVPITAIELGEFLYRVGRVRTKVDTDIGEFTSRPYPSGGASYELEIYVTVDRCLGLNRGFYYYDPGRHLLCLVSEPQEDMEWLILEAFNSSAQVSRPHIVLTVASRFQRVAWKYSGIAYATQLKNLGVLYATMYLVATAMGLAACGLGAGNSERFCRLAKTSPFEEASIGEFMLGRPAPGA
jgi:oxazoline/thiazoline dehydrogenase